MENSEFLTIRQYLFLKWLYKRKILGEFCAINGTDIQCFNCLKNNAECLTGVIPASFFAKKIDRQFTDCKRVLDSLVKWEYIVEKQTVAKEFRVFYQITPKGIEFLEEFERNYNINGNHTLKKPPVVP